MASFATVADLETFLRKDFAVGSETDQAQAALDTATAEMKAHMGQNIAQVTADQITLDANGAGVLFLPERPVTAVSAVTVDGTALTVANDVDWYSYGALYRDRDRGGTWGDERQSVVVTYTHGYATIPDDIKRVCVKRAARILGSPAVGSATVAADSEGNPTGRRWSMEGPLEPFDDADLTVMRAYMVPAIA